MKNIQIILNTILSKDMFQYILIDKSYNISSISEGVENYLGKVVNIGDDILDYLPELLGYESEIESVLKKETSSYILDSISINSYYLNIFIEYYNDENIMILFQNITDITYSKQRLLQYSNESVLLNNTLEKIINRQNALLFVTSRDDIVYANKKFLDYFKIDDLKNQNVSIYKYLDNPLDSYNSLFKLVEKEERYININKDTFILKSTLIETTHKLFTLSRVTELSNENNIDTLTGLYKKSFLISHLKICLTKNEPYVIIVIDLDNFKLVNDKYGHLTGDSVLKEFANLIKSNIRKEDIFARWGGEEFLLLLKNTSIENGIKKIERVYNMINTHKFKHIGEQTASFGITNGVEGDDVDSIVERADKALYEAKHNGRNQIVSKKV
ncbi:MAG: GGDEF domain-containing protein [Sulfurovum sp.]